MVRTFRPRSFYHLLVSAKSESRGASISTFASLHRDVRERFRVPTVEIGGA